MTFPTVSIVIPVLDGEDVIASALHAALDQRYRGSIEIIVAHGPSMDGTHGVLERFGNRVTVVDNPSGGRSAGLNRAIEASSGEVIVRCDAHARLPADYVDIAVEILAETGASVVGGLQAAIGTSATERAIAIAQSTPLGVGDARYRTGGTAGEVDTVYLGVFPRHVLQSMGGYDETLQINEDYELCWRIREKGGKVWFDPDLHVSYRPRAGLGALWMQYFRYGSWKREMLRRHPRSLRWRQLAAPLLVLALVVSGVLAATVSPRLGAAVPAAYSVLLLLAGVGLLLRRRDLAALFAPAALVTMHIGWGSGFLLSRRKTKR